MNKLGDSIKKHKDGVLLDIFVTTKAKDALFPSGYNPWRKKIEIKVTSEAKDNLANIEVIKTIAEFFLKSKTDVTIISGQKSKEKTIFIKNISVDEVLKKIGKSLDGL